MESSETLAATPRMPADADVSQSVGQTSINQLGLQGRSVASQDQRQSRLETDGCDRRQLWGHSLQPEFQDSNLSPALPLLPGNTGMEHMFTEYSLFEQSDTAFVPLRPFPDISMVSGRFHIPAQDDTTQASERGSLSQHPLAQETILSEGENSCCSLSQHSLSPGDILKEALPSSLIVTTDRQGVTSGDNTGSGKDSAPVTDPPDKPVGEASDDEAFFLNKDIPAQHLLELLQKDIGMPSGSSSAVSSTSETSVKAAATFSKESKSTQVFKPGTEQSMLRRHRPSGEASLQQPDGNLYPDQSQTSSEVCNITTGLRSTQPDDSCHVLHRELLSEVERRNSHEAECVKPQQQSPTLLGQSLTLLPTGSPKGKEGVARSNLHGVSWTEPFSAGTERAHREQDPWSSGNQTGIDGSYLGFLPQSQSTPGFFKAPPKSSVKSKVGQLPAIDQSDTQISPQPADVHDAPASNQGQEGTASAKVQSLPSLSYMQKVDAWRANQTSGKTSLFDSLVLQGLSGISPKKKAYDAVSDTLNRILSQQARSLKQPLVSGATSQTNTQRSSKTPSGSSVFKRGEAVGSSPGNKENTGPAAGRSASQSHSSLSTVVMSAKKHQPTESCAEREESPTEDAVHPQRSAAAQPSPLINLGHFSDVSPDPDLTLSSSNNSSGIKVDASVGASSVVSLEVDNYAPYWTSKPSTPQPRPRELNIEERIPVYLRNLGIDQSPSAILTPFVPRGPIREPEFSPSDLCTVKGSVGTPTKSTQPSEGSSPQKGEFSMSSVPSVDSSMSIQFSLDSLGPSVPEPTRQALCASDTEAVQAEPRLAPSSQPDEDSYASTLQTTVQQQRDSSLTSSQNTIQRGDGFDSDPSLTSEPRDLESPLQTSRSLEDNAETSFVSSKALLEIRKLLSQAENVVSAGSSVASSAPPAAPHLLSHEDLYLSLRKRAQDSSFTSSSATGGPTCRSSLRWARSSSDSMLSSEKVRESSVGQESTTSPGQPNHPPASPLISTTAAGAYRRPQDGTAGGGAGSAFILSQSVRRAEPEGCSAAPPDAVPPQPPVVRSPPASSPQQLTPTPPQADSVTGEDNQDALEAPAQSSSSSPLHEDTDQGVVSDGSSESSLAVRVAKLLQSESPATVVSSTPSNTDQEDGRAREWVKLKQQCEPLQLDQEDRRRIEEIKRELLLRNPLMSQGSTDTDSSSVSSLGVLRGQDLARQAAVFTALRDVNKQQPRALQDLGPDPSVSSVPLQNPHMDLEAQIREIAAKEGVTLPQRNPRALTSITIATRRRSSSPSPSASPAPPVSPVPEPLHLKELSTGTVRQPEAHRQLLAVGAPPSQQDDDTQALRPEVIQLSVQDEPVSAVSPEAQQARRSSAPESPARLSHVSHVHLTLSPKTGDHSSAPAVRAGHVDAAAGLPHKDFVSLRQTSSPDEGVGLSSPPEWYDSREPIRQRAPERADTSTLFGAAVPHGRLTATSPRSFKPGHRAVVSPRPPNPEPAAVPVLLPYKPCGSEELFYVPQTEADFSADPSDTSVESSHTGSDDAVPPRFSSDVLGHGDPGLDRGVAIRHTEGIYSKRLKTRTLSMHEPEDRGASVLADGSKASKPSSLVSAASTSAPPSSQQEPSKRDQGTSPVQFLSYDPPERSGGRFQLLRHGPDRSSDPPQPSLDQLWERFCSQWSPEEPRPSGGREASLLERLERLSRLIHSTKSPNAPETPHDPRERQGRRREDAAGRERKKLAGEMRAAGEVGETRRRVGGGRATDGQALAPHRAWTQRPVGDDQDSVTSSHHARHPRPADRDESENLSTTSGSLSTVDTARLVRAFGAHRVQRLKTSSGLSKLYGTISKQKEEREQRGRDGELAHGVTPSDTADESSVAADSASSVSTYTVGSHHHPSRTLTAKKAVKLVNKGVQAGDLELVWNGTRRHTRDVGTTFPSPGEARTPRRSASSSSSFERGGGGGRSTSKTQDAQKPRRSKRSPPKTHPEGVSWFISAGELRAEARKENRPEEEESTWRLSAAWFELYSRVKPWREPLRQRQVPEDRNSRPWSAPQVEPDVEPRTKTSSLDRMSLQEALAVRRPDFISQSRQRVERLALQAEERRLQEVFSREREELFSRPGGAGRLPKPAGTALFRRAVPRKEMIQRSKQIYDSLPEVQRRREEERRKAEYQSYRLNAQLYNKRITSRVLGRRRAWQ